MKQKAKCKQQAFTRIELIVVIILVLVGLVVILLLSVAKGIRRGVSRTECPYTLRDIGTAYRIWAEDHNGHFAASESVSNGGWKELLANPDQGAICWTNYAIMANELQTPKLLLCVADDRQAAANFTNGFDNTHVSYFVGVSANSNAPNSILAGDRNLGGGIEPDRDYGFSPKSDKGNDVAMQTNSLTGPVSWSLKMHSFGNPSGAGTILLSDGSSRFVSSSSSFRQNWQPFAGYTTNWPAGHFPATPSIRLVFP